MIIFLCPNGHKLSRPDHHAGRAGTCPDCGVRFRVPQPEPEEVEEAAVHESENAAVELPSPQRDGDSDLIVFLCPNGHRLHGPSNLAGRAGQCPHCGSRFRIPALTEEESVEAAREDSPADAHIDLQAEQPSEQIADAEESELPLEEIEEVVDELARPSIEIKHAEQVVAAAAAKFDQLNRDQRPGTGTYGLHVIGSEGIERPVGAVHPLAEMFEQIWNRPFGDAGVELKLTSGETLTPAYYAADLSQRSHAFFALREPDGRFSLVAFPWERVARVTVRGLEILPPEFN